MTDEKPRLLVLQEEISACKGTAVVGYLRLLDEACFAADINHRELVAGVKKVTNPKTALDLSLLRNREKLRLVQLEIARLLQNYLDSADSLLDRINDLVKNTMPEMEKDWDEHRRKADREPAIAFVKELRAHVHHSRQPSMTSTFRFEREDEEGFAFSAVLSVSRQRLQSARHWGKQAKRFLDSRPEDMISLDRLASDTFPIIRDVLEWTVNKIRQTYKLDLSELNALQRKYSAEYEREFGTGMTGQQSRIRS